MKQKYRKAVFIVAYVRTEKGIEYLLLKRKLHWNGWEFPKGAIKFLETKKRAVRRELFEETGLKAEKITKFNFYGKYDYAKILSDRQKVRGQTFSLYSAKLKKEKIKVDNYEHSNYKWVFYKEAIKMLKWKNQKKCIRIVNDFLTRRKNEK